MLEERHAAWPLLVSLKGPLKERTPSLTQECLIIEKRWVLRMSWVVESLPLSSRLKPLPILVIALAVTF